MKPLMLGASHLWVQIFYVPVMNESMNKNDIIMKIINELNCRYEIKCMILAVLNFIWLFHPRILAIPGNLENLENLNLEISILEIWLLHSYNSSLFYLAVVLCSEVIHSGAERLASSTAPSVQPHRATPLT